MTATESARKPAERTLGEVFSDAREAMIPRPSFETISRRMFAELDIEVSHTTLASYHANAIKNPDVEIVQALVDYYGLSLNDLPASMRARFDRLRTRLIATARRRKYAPRDSNPEPADIARGGAVAA